MGAPAIPTYKVNDRRGIGHGGNNLFEAANPRGDGNKRKRFPRVDRDTRQNLSEWGHRELMSAARYLWGRFGPIRGAIWQMATYAIGCGYQVQYTGRNRAWGLKMEEAIYEADKICDIRGGPYDFRQGLILDLVSIIRDGDTSCVLTQTDTDYPQFQSIPAHRIGNFGTMTGDVVADGQFKGRTIQSGAILNDYGRAIAFRVGTGGDECVDIPAGNMFQEYRAEFMDQPRGITWLASAIYDADDILELRNYLKTALKAESSITMIEHNEAGSPMGIGSALVGGSTTSTDDGTATVEPSVEYFDDNTVRYFRAGTNSKIEAPNTQRPSQNAQDFSFEILRGAFEALSWPIEFYNPEALGGANIRMRIAQASRTVESLQHIAERIAKRKHTYMIAKLIKLGLLEPDEDWWRIEHKKPRDLTVDNGRDTKADLELYRMGMITMDELTSRMGDYWEEVQDQRILEAKRKSERCAAEGVDPSEIQMMTPNGNPAGQQPVEDAPEETNTEDKASK